eukprot:10872685-Lingulodinium_polyedra.AAC.1
MAEGVVFQRETTGPRRRLGLAERCSVGIGVHCISKAGHHVVEPVSFGQGVEGTPPQDQWRASIPE